MLSVAAHPGLFETELIRTRKPWQRALVRLHHGNIDLHPPREAVRPTVMAALAPDAAGGQELRPARASVR